MHNLTKVSSDDATLMLVGRLFQTTTPEYEKLPLYKVMHGLPDVTSERQVYNFAWFNRNVNGFYGPNGRNCITYIYHIIK